MSASKVVVPTADEIRGWTATFPATQAGAAFGLGPDKTYELIRTGEFPVPVLKLGRAYRVARSALMSALGIPEAPPAAPGNPLATRPSAQLVAAASDPRSEVRAA